MNQNQTNMAGMPTNSQGFKLEIPKENRNLYYGFLASVVAMIIGCFLPLYKIAGQSINYIYNKGDLSDGIFLIVLGIGAIGVLLWKKNAIIPLVCQGISAFLFLKLWSDVKDVFSAYNSYAGLLGDKYKATYGIGFWIILLGIIGSIACLALIFKKMQDDKKGQAVAQPIPVQPNVAEPVQPQVVAQNNCPYCGSPKTEGSPFCGNCGAKF